MTLNEIAKDLVDGCRDGQAAQNLDRLYAPDAISVEAMSPDGRDRITRGRDGIRQKHVWWDENATVHASAVEGPFIGGDDSFAVVFEVDATLFGERTKTREVGLYTVRDGLIVREPFFHAAP